MIGAGIPIVSGTLTHDQSIMALLVMVGVILVALLVLARWGEDERND